MYMNIHKHEYLYINLHKHLHFLTLLMSVFRNLQKFNANLVNMRFKKNIV